MLPAIEANPIGFLFHSEDPSLMAVAAAEKDLVEEIEDFAKNTHGSHSPPPSHRFTDERKKRPQGSY